MVTAVPPADDTDASDPTALSLGQQLAALRELREIGMDLARGLRDRAAETDAGDLGLAFSRISRAIRQTIALETHITEEGQTRERQIRAAREKAASERRERIAGHKHLVESSVSEAITEIERPERERERLLDDLDDWMDRAEDEDFDTRPIGEIVARICRDLGMKFEYEFWEMEDWAQEEIRYRIPGSPYALRMRDRLRADAPPPGTPFAQPPAAAGGLERPP